MMSGASSTRGRAVAMLLLGSCTAAEQVPVDAVPYEQELDCPAIGCSPSVAFHVDTPLRPAFGGFVQACLDDDCHRERLLFSTTGTVHFGEDERTYVDVDVLVLKLRGRTGRLRATPPSR